MKPRYFLRDGKLWHVTEAFPDGCYLPHETAVKLLPLFEAERWSKDLARQLRTALNHYEAYHMEQAA